MSLLCEWTFPRKEGSSHTSCTILVSSVAVTGGNEGKLKWLRSDFTSAGPKVNWGVWAHTLIPTDHPHWWWGSGCPSTRGFSGPALLYTWQHPSVTQAPGGTCHSRSLLCRWHRGRYRQQDMEHGLVLFLEHLVLLTAGDDGAIAWVTQRALGNPCRVEHPDGRRLLFLHSPPMLRWEGQGCCCPMVPVPG